MKPAKKYLRTQIVCNFFNDVRNIINKQIINTACAINNNGNKKIHAK